MNKAQIDGLGERLRQDSLTEADLRDLQEYRLSFNDAYKHVVETISRELGLEPTGRPTKSTPSIRDKLQRQSVRFSQMQDIAGCRIVVSTIHDQTSVLESLQRVFNVERTMDRRKRPSNGYRAVHLIVRERGKLVEIQIRTTLQHLWAEVSEKLSDTVDPAIKYGGGPESCKELLAMASDNVAGSEKSDERLLKLENRFQEADRRLTDAERKGVSTEESVRIQKARTKAQRAIADLRAKADASKQELKQGLEEISLFAQKLKGGGGDLSD